MQHAILFGSRAMGTHRANSDIDLCLDAPDLSFQSFLQLASVLDELVLPYRLDLILKHHIDNPDLLNHIQRVGLVVK
ncbi:nucleotidyltransferase family protein [Marinomonas arctica]|uniref:nucleotidyltransferase family protein n=1 Tax=Marinomonas TaxID=28253 RepID=UPI003B8A8A6A